MDKVLYYDYCAVLVLIILLFTTLYRGMNRGRAQKIYIALILLSFLSAVSDVTAVRLEQMGDGLLELKHLAHSFYLIFHSASTPVYMLYLLILSDTEHKMRKLQRVLFWLPLVLVVLVAVSNPIHNQLFYFNENDVYTRGSLFWILYLCVFFYVSFGISHLWIHKKNYARTQMIGLSSVFVLNIGAMVIQLFYPMVLCEMFANALGLLAILCMLQRPEEYIDTDSGIGKESAYAQKIGRVIANEKPCKLIMIDLKNYTSLQQMLGYQKSVALTRAVADRLEELKEKNSYFLENYYIGAGRYRMLIEPSSTKATDTLAEAVNEILSGNFDFNDMSVQLLPVICIVDFSSDISDMESLMVLGGEFDKSDYTGKIMNAGEVLQKRSYDIMRDIDLIIERALADNRLQVYYQPIYSVKEKNFNSAEALLRLNDEKYGFISPDIFITAAEKSGRINRIGTFVFESVCSFIASEEFKNSCLEYIEINLSVAQCMRSDLVDEVLSILKKYGVSANQINLEITETTASYSQKALSENINKLTKNGISLSLDDYGTGYSNMRRIASMPFDIIKLDKSFAVSDTDPKMRIVIENTIRMIKDMGLKIVVEGIETDELALMFADLNCDYIQGYYYSKPIPKDEFVEFINNH